MKTGPGSWGYFLYGCAAVVVALMSRVEDLPLEYLILAIIATITFATIGRSISIRRSEAIQRERDRHAMTFCVMALQGRTPPPFFLYLRPFETTTRLTQATTYLNTDPRFYAGEPEMEQCLANVLDQYAPLIGLGEPGAGIGAGRAAVTDAVWKRTVSLLLTHCKHAFLVPGDHAGTLWEISTIRHRPDLLLRTVFIMPQWSRGFPVEDHWKGVSLVLLRMGVTLPTYDKRGLLFSLDATGGVDRQAALPALITREGQLREALREFMDLEHIGGEYAAASTQLEVDAVESMAVSAALDRAGRSAARPGRKAGLQLCFLLAVWASVLALFVDVGSILVSAPLISLFGLLVGISDASAGLSLRRSLVGYSAPIVCFFCFCLIKILDWGRDAAGPLSVIGSTYAVVVTVAIVLRLTRVGDQ